MNPKVVVKWLLVSFRKYMEEKLPKLLRHTIQSLHSYELLEHEVHQLAEGGDTGQLFFNIMSITLTLGISTLLTLLTIKIPESELWKLLLFIVLTVFGIGSGLILFFLWRGAKKRQLPLLSIILARPVIGPVGEAGKELTPTEVKSLPESQDQEGK